jgi:hypothetical protein
MQREHGKLGMNIEAYVLATHRIVLASFEEDNARSYSSIPFYDWRKEREVI